MLPFHSCYTYVTWRSKKVGDLKSSHGRKRGHATKGGKGGGSYGVALNSQLVYLNYLPIPVSFDVKRVLSYALHNIPSC